MSAAVYAEPTTAFAQSVWQPNVTANGGSYTGRHAIVNNGGHLDIGTSPSNPPASVTFGNSGDPADSDNGYAKVDAGGEVTIKNKGTLNINAAPASDKNPNYPTLQIGTSAGSGAATVTMDDGNLNIPDGQIQVGDLAGQPSSAQGGPASLTATNGSNITGGFQIGIGGNSASTVTLTDSNYSDNGMGVIVGANGKNNSLTETGGAMHVSGGMAVGFNNGSEGTATLNNIKDANITGGLFAGYGGKGTVNITPVSSVSVDNIDVGTYSKGDGTVNIGGSVDKDGNWSPDNSLTGNSNSDLATVNVSDGVIVGDAGKGTLNVGQQGLLSINGGNLVIGNQAGSDGTMNITPSSAHPSVLVYGPNGRQGQGETPTSGPAMIVGNEGKGTLNITGDKNANNAASMGVNGVTVGARQGSNGSINVDGSNAMMNDNGNLIIGQDDGAHGTLDIKNGGQVSISAAAMSGSLDVGQNKGSEGVVNVDGAGSSLTLTNGNANWNTPQQTAVPAQIAIVGDNGNGKLNVTDGGAVTIQAAHGLIMGNQQDGKGDIAVDHGTLTSGSITVGNEGTGTLDISNNSTVNVDGNVPDAQGKQDNGGNGYVKVGGGSSIAINSGSTVNITGPGADGSGDYPTLQIGTNTNSSAATVTMDHGNLNVGSDTDMGDGQIQVGDLIGQPSDGKGGAASLTATNGSNINGGLQIGAGGNSSSTVSLTDSNYNDNGWGVQVGIRGGNNTYTQNGGKADISGGATVGGLSGSSGVMNFNDGAKANISYGLIAGYGAGTKGDINVTTGSQVNADNIWLGGDGGTGSLTIDGKNSTVNVGDSAQPAGPLNSSNGYVKVAGGSNIDITNGGALNIDAQPTKNADGSFSNYPTLQIGTTVGDQAATVTMDHGTLNVGSVGHDGQIQVGDLAGATGNPDAAGGGAASLTATDSTINGGLQIGSGGNSSATVNLKDSTYNDNGYGVYIGDSGTNNSFNQSGGTSTATLVDVGSGTSGSLNLSNNAVLNIAPSEDGGLVVGDYGTGTATFDHSTLNAAGAMIDIGNNEGPQGSSLTFQNNSKATAGNVIVGDGGTGVMNLLSGSKGNFDNVYIGAQTSTGTGTVNVNASQMHVADTTVVGTAANGVMNITDGGLVTTSSLVVGNSANAAGEINVDNKSHLIVNPNTSNILASQFFKTNDSDSASNVSLAVIGYEDNGAVNVNGGLLTLNADATVIADNEGVKGSVNMGNNSTIDTQGFLLHGAGDASMSLDHANFNAIGDLYDDVDTAFSAQSTINTNNNFVTLDSKLSGDGGFNKIGNGVLEIDNKENNYHGVTNVEQGSLQGIGTIGGNLNIGSGATLRPGQSANPVENYGTMRINGSTTLEDGSTFEANVAGAGPTQDYLHSSILDAAKNVAINNGSTLAVKVEQGAQLKLNQAYELIHADGGVSGKFTQYDQDKKIGGTGKFDYGVIYSTGPSYTPNDVQIRWLFDAKKGAGWNGDRNQTGIGNRLSDSVNNPNSPLFGIANILVGSDNEQRLHNLTQLDGEIASDMRTGNINNNFWVRDSVNNRLDCLEDTFRQIGNGQTTNSNVCGVTGKKVNVWGNMYGGVGGQNGHSGWDYAAKAKDNDAGFIWGVDGEIGSDGYAEDRWHVGMMMGYGSVMESASGVSSSGESNNANIGMYFGKQVRFDNQNFFTFHGQFGYTWNIMSWHRSVNLEGAAAQYNQSLHANELGGTAHVNAEIAYKHVFNLWGTPLEVAPTGSITYLNYEQGSYHEHGGDLALQGRATNTNLGYGFMGMKLATNFNIGNVVITPHGKFGYRRSFGANQSYTHVGFEALGGGNTSIDPSIVGVPVVQDQALTELGFDVHPTDYLTFGANYVGLYGGHEQTMSGGQLSAKIAF